MSKITTIGKGKHDNAIAFVHEFMSEIKPHFAVVMYAFDPDQPGFPMLGGEVNAEQVHHALAGAMSLRIAAMDPEERDEL